jgi:hypothetical protein
MGMKTLNYSGQRLRQYLFSVTGTVLMLIMLAGCASGNYGSLTWDRELDNMFESYQVLPEHHYYITGGYGAPAAILAIHENFQLDNEANLWVPVPDVSPNQMKKWVDNLAPEINFWDKSHFFAFYILDPDGNRVGAWYSGQKNTTVNFLDDNRIRVFPPDLKPEFGGDAIMDGIIRP